MRELRNLDYRGHEKNILARLKPERREDFTTPYAEICDGKRAFFRGDTPTDRVFLCYCIPATNRDGSHIENFHALPISQLDVLNGIALLNQCLTVRESSPDYEMAVEAMDTALEELEKIRPHKILCAETKFASKGTIHFLEGEGFRAGRPEVKLDEVCYLGAVRTNEGFLRAIGLGGAVMVSNVPENLPGEFIGPVYNIRDITQPSSPCRTFRGLAVKFIDGYLIRRLQRKYFGSYTASRNPVDEMVKDMLID